MALIIIIQHLKNFVKGKHSSLFCRSVNKKKEKFISLASGDAKLARKAIERMTVCGAFYMH
jgi:hypothetical protein